MTYAEEEYLLLSGIQHYAFCPRQWALMTIEQQWQDNALTIDGALMHENAHDEEASELRGETLILRGLRVASPTLGVSGACDVVEFRRDEEKGVPLMGYAGRWRPFPVEYKHGRPKTHQADELQLCLQAMCLEEMLACPIPDGALFYGETRRRTDVDFTTELRNTVRSQLLEMHACITRGYTPRVKKRKDCGSCSLAALCVPELPERGVSIYLRERLKEISEEAEESEM